MKRAERDFKTEQVYTTAKGRAQAIGEYESTKALHAVIPQNVPRPYALGVLSTDPSKHFLIVEFKDMLEETPPVAELASVMANLHTNSASPTGKFGFTVPTSQSLQLENTWTDTWEEFFTRAFRGTVKLEQEIQGVNEELQHLAEEVCEKVIPRLLRPMESDGRRIKPSLVHGDLWHGNLGIDVMTDQVILYDCCAFYGHHECECSPTPRRAMEWTEGAWGVGRERILCRKKRDLPPGPFPSFTSSSKPPLGPTLTPLIKTT